MDHPYPNHTQFNSSDPHHLQSQQLQFLLNKVQELEAQNAQLLLLVSKCRCHNNKIDGNFDAEVSGKTGLIDHMKKLKLGSGDKIKKKSSKNIDGGCNTWPTCHQRYIALKIMYFGQRFYGFASEAQMDPTVESEMFKALKKTRLVFGDKKDWQYSRCGRTDKGVSSVGQVIALYLRSKHKNTTDTENSGNFVTEDIYEGELDYVRILNKALPKDIRVIGWCPAPTDFSARFSCLSREYKYFFWKDNLNIPAMEAAGKKLVGEHDFRNFCKMDAANVHNYRRHITLFEICPSLERYEGNELWSMKIKGSAFLWHQVRCMVAVLFLIGQGLESPNVLEVLLDVKQISRKPQYKMAAEYPLVLRSCEFEGLIFKCSTDARQALQLHFEKECLAYKLQAAICHEALLSCSRIENDDIVSSYGTKKKAALHVPLMSRPSEPSYEERCTKLKRDDQ